MITRRDLVICLMLGFPFGLQGAHAESFLTPLDEIPSLLSPESQCALPSRELSPAESFCQDPVEFICGKGQPSSIERLLDGQKKYKDWADGAFITYVSGAKSAAGGMTNLMRQAYAKSAAPQVMSWHVLNQEVDGLKKELLLRLKRKDIPGKTLEKVEKQLSEVALMSPEEIGDAYGKGVKAREQGSREPDRSFERRCDLDGSVLNARYDSELKRLIVCPGFIASHAKLVQHIRDPKEQRAELFSLMRQVLLHEIGHSIDYASLKPESDTLYETVVADVPTTLLTFFSDEGKAEVTADYLAIEGQLERIASSGKTFSASYLAGLFKKRYQIDCAYRAKDWGFWTGFNGFDNDHHPPGGWRIEYLASHPEVRTRLGCKNTKETRELKSIPDRQASK